MLNNIAPKVCVVVGREGTGIGEIETNANLSAAVVSKGHEQKPMKRCQQYTRILILVIRTRLPQRLQGDLFLELAFCIHAYCRIIKYRFVITTYYGYSILGTLYWLKLLKEF